MSIKFLYMIYAFLSFCFVSSLALADVQKNEPSVRAYVDKKTILIGERIRCSIDVAAGQDEEIEFSKPEGDRIGAFEIKDSGSRAKKNFFGKRTFSRWYVITAYSVGKQSIPPLEVRYRIKASGKDWKVKKTAEIPITVESLLPRNGKISDIKDIKGPLYFYELNLFLAAMAIIISICGVWAAIRYRNFRKKTKLKLPHEIALEELERMRGLLSRTGDIKGYYVGISDCIRRYVENVFKLRAPEMTTEEFLSSLKDSSVLSGSQKISMREFLTSCDLVKFAKYAPKKSEIEAVFVTAKNFVVETKELSLKMSAGVRR